MVEDVPVVDEAAGVDEAARVAKGNSVDVDEGEAALQMLLNPIPKHIVLNLGLQVLCPNLLPGLVPPPPNLAFAND